MKRTTTMAKIHGNTLTPVLPSPANSGFAIGRFLQEHADYERKSLDYALTIIGKYPDKTFAIDGLCSIAQDTMGIFAEVCHLMLRHNLPLMPESPQNLYLKQIAWLARSTREDRFIDRVILGSIAEKRCAVRFAEIALLAENVEIGLFYEKCAAHKETFSALYMGMALQSGIAADVVQQRFAELTAEEAKAMAAQAGVAGIF